MHARRILLPGPTRRTLSSSSRAGTQLCGYCGYVPETTQGIPGIPPGRCSSRADKGTDVRPWETGYYDADTAGGALRGGTQGETLVPPYGYTRKCVSISERIVYHSLNPSICISLHLYIYIYLYSLSLPLSPLSTSLYINPYIVLACAPSLYLYLSKLIRQGRECSPLTAGDDDDDAADARMEIVMDSAGHGLIQTPISAQLELLCP